MDKLIAFSNKTEGRDKACKVVQYACRIIKAWLTDSLIKERLDGLAFACRDARKMFRLWKFVQEYQAIQKIRTRISVDGVENALQITARAAYFLYWVFDNLQILSLIKFLKFDSEEMGKRANKAWFVAVIISVFALFRGLAVNFNQELKIRYSCDPTLQTTRQSIDLNRKKRNEMLLNLLKHLGNLLPSSAFAGIPRLFKRSIPEAWIGFGGALAGSVSIYQAWG